MNFRLVLCIALGLFTTYIGVFMLVRQLRPAPGAPQPPRPNFSARATTVTDAETGEKTTYREITVTTKFAPGPATPPPEKPRLNEWAAPVPLERAGQSSELEITASPARAGGAWGGRGRW